MTENVCVIHQRDASVEIKLDNIARSVTVGGTSVLRGYGSHFLNPKTRILNTLKVVGIERKMFNLYKLYNQ